MSKSEPNEKKARIFYARVDEFWRKGEKYAYLEEKQHVGNIEWQEVQPDAKHNWLTEGIQSDYEIFLPLGTKSAKESDQLSETIFKVFSNGVKTNRDTWVYNFDAQALTENIKKLIETYNEQVFKWQRNVNKKVKVDDFVEVDSREISWSEGLKNFLQRGISIEYNKGELRRSLYRPFASLSLYFDAYLNERRYLIPTFLPTEKTERENRIICFTALGNNKPFHSLMAKLTPDLHLTGDSSCFPFYTYNEDGTNRRENITDWALEKFREQYGDGSITKWDIFHYVYALLHHPVYRERYAANLKRELPRIPFAGTRAGTSPAPTKIFRAFADAGARLAEIHVHYEEQPEYPLEKIEQKGAALSWRVEKMRLGKEKRELVYNEFLTLAGIPQEAFEYRLGNRSALEWVIDQYQVSTDRRSGITNDPNRPEDPTYILRLVGQVVTVSLETVELVRSLPGLGI